MRTPLSALIPPLSFTAVWKAITGHGLTPPPTHTLSRVYFRPPLWSPSTAPPQQPLLPISLLSRSQLTAEAACRLTSGTRRPGLSPAVATEWSPLFGLGPCGRIPPLPHPLRSQVAIYIPRSRAASSPWMRTMPFRTACVQSSRSPKHSG